MWGHMPGWDGWSSGWVWFAVGHVLWWTLLIVAIVVLLRFALRRRAAPSAATPDRALELLRERFARGEIDEQEFEARRRVLKG